MQHDAKRQNFDAKINWGWRKMTHFWAECHSKLALYSLNLQLEYCIK